MYLRCLVGAVLPCFFAQGRFIGFYPLFAPIEVLNLLVVSIHAPHAGERHGGKLPTFCSNEWKKHVIRRWLRANDYNDVDVWLGISTDELERMKPSKLNWYRHVYPLIEMIPTTRAQCSALVESFGWPTPPKSRCWMCPNQSPQMWSEMRRTQPQEFDKAVALESELQAHDEHIYLHRAMIPLVDAVNLTDQQPGLFDGCDSGYCFV